MSGSAHGPRARAEWTVQEQVVMVCDLHDFSKVCAAITGDDASLVVADFLQRFYVAMGDLIVGSGGRLIKYIADCIVALFPAGSELETVRCAARMRSAYAELLAGYGTGVESDLEVGIGAGRVSVGVFGHPSLRTYDTFGTLVNEVSTIGHHRGIAVTAVVNERVAGKVTTRPLSGIPVKWSPAPLQIWEVDESSLAGG